MVSGVGENLTSGEDVQLVVRVVERREVEDANDPALPDSPGKHTELMVVIRGAVHDVHLSAANTGREDHKSIQGVVRRGAALDNPEHVTFEANTLLAERNV